MDPIEEAQKALNQILTDARAQGPGENQEELLGIAAVIDSLGNARRRSANLDAENLRQEAIRRGDRAPSDAQIVATLLDEELARRIKDEKERDERSKHNQLPADRARDDAAAANAIMASDQ